MVLARMIRTDEDALVCDLAETYGIYDYRSLPVWTVATLSCGLRDSSRIKMKMAGEVLSFERMMLVNIYDRVNWLAWAESKGAQEGGKPPEALLGKLLGLEKEEKKEEFVFESGEEFEKAREKLLGGEE